MAIDSTASSASLAPGFRFHPTDEELVRYYLRRKVCGKSFRFDAISEVDVYKAEPWDLPGMSRLKSRDLEWYFFSVLDKKYGNGSRTNRATEKGYWKTTGKDRNVYHRSKIVGMKKTLVYHKGRAPKGERTNWVMHEYRLVDEELEKAGVFQDAFVLIRIFQKSGSGPKNGEQYGAPFIAEEWEEDELEIVPKLEGLEEVVAGDDYLDGDDLVQILGTDVQSADCPLPLNMHLGDTSTYADESNEFMEDGQKLLINLEESCYKSKQPDDQELFDPSVQYDMSANLVKREFIGESSHMVNPPDLDYLVDDPFVDATDTPYFGDGAFLETNDLSYPIEADPSSFDLVNEYLTFFDAENNDSEYLAFDPSEMIGNENLVCDQAALDQKSVEETTQQPDAPTQLLSGQKNDIASSSTQKPTTLGSDIQYPFIKTANNMLASIPAPPAFASEFPTKDVAVHLNSVAQSSVHVTAGMIQIRNMTTLSRQGTDWSNVKPGNINIVLSFGLSGPDGSSSLEPMVGVHLGKTGSALFRGWFFFICLWVMILSIGVKVGSLINAK